MALLAQRHEVAPKGARDTGSRFNRGMTMPARITRRATVLGLAAALPVCAAPWGAREAKAAGRFAALERARGGRLGVAVLDTETGRRMTHRGDELFPLCSTFKFLAAAAVLARVDRKEERLDRRIPVAKSDLVPYSPVTEKRAGEEMTVAEICEAAMTLSDNTAGNLLLESLGGPSGLTAFVRSLGDSVTRLDRFETELNEVGPGDPRDTTTPLAMIRNLNKLLLEPTLSESSRRHLTAWLVGNKTGDARLRAGFPPDWRIGDKTGTGNGIANDIAVVWPVERAPVLVAAYLRGARAPVEARNVVLAEVARIIAADLSG